MEIKKRKGEIIGIIHEKGGVGKTNTAFNLGGTLAYLGFKVLWVDFDPQAILTKTLNYYKATPRFDCLNIYRCFEKSESLYESIIRYQFSNLYYIPSHKDLKELEHNRLMQEIAFHKKLKRLLNPIKNNFDYIIIDGSPSLGKLCSNILTAADKIIVPVNCSCEAIPSLHDIIDKIKNLEENEKKLDKKYIMFNMYNNINNNSPIIYDFVKENEYYKYNFTFLNTIIKDSVKFQYTIFYNIPIVFWDEYKNNYPEVFRNYDSLKEDYINLTKEVIL
jgi:chromosome partitioning protein